MSAQRINWLRCSVPAHRHTGAPEPAPRPNAKPTPANRALGSARVAVDEVVRTARRWRQKTGDRIPGHVAQSHFVLLTSAHDVDAIAQFLMRLVGRGTFPVSRIAGRHESCAFLFNDLLASDDDRDTVATW